MKKLSQKEVITAVHTWIESAESDKKAAEILFREKQYRQCSFLIHLTLEKLFKAHFVAYNKTQAIFIHDLTELAQKTHFVFPPMLELWLQNINHFNLVGRYPDFYDPLRKECFKKNYMRQSLSAMYVISSRLQKRFHANHPTMKKLWI